MTPREGGHFRPRSYNSNKLGRGLLGDAKIPNIKALGLVISDKKIFSHFPYICLCKTCDYRGRAIFGHRAINLVDVHLVMLNIKYQV